VRKIFNHRGYRVTQRFTPHTPCQSLFLSSPRRSSPSAAGCLSPFARIRFYQLCGSGPQGAEGGRLFLIY